MTARKWAEFAFLVGSAAAIMYAEGSYSRSPGPLFAVAGALLMAAAFIMPLRRG